MICALTSGSAQKTSNTGAKVVEFDLALGAVAFEGEIKVNRSPDGFSVTNSGTGTPLLGHLFEYRQMYEWVAERPEGNPDYTARGNLDSCRSVTSGGYTFLTVTREGQCQFYSTATGKPNAAGSYKLTAGVRLQLLPRVTVTATVPTPQSELSGATSFGRFVWRGAIYKTAEVDGRAFIGKRRSSSFASGVQLIGFAHPKQCEKAPDLAIKDGIKEVDESLLLERGYITPLTRNLHLGSAVALIQGTAYLSQKTLEFDSSTMQIF
jgi:hypothetical protein